MRLAAVVFSSHIFIFYFLPLVAGGYHLLLWRGAGIGMRNFFLTSAGLVFYGSWNPWFVPLMLGAMTLDYHLGRMIVNAGDDRRCGRLAAVSHVRGQHGRLVYAVEGCPHGGVLREYGTVRERPWSAGGIDIASRVAAVACRGQEVEQEQA